MLVSTSMMRVPKCAEFRRDKNSAVGKTYVEGMCRYCIPSNDVRTLPDTADSIFCPSDTSPTPLGSASSARWVAVAMVPVVGMAAERRVTSQR